MRKLVPTLAAAAVLATLGAVTPAAAGVLSGPQGLRTAIDAVDITDTVHCRPGIWHHRRGARDGCYRRYRSYYGGPYYSAPYYSAPYYRPYYSPYYGYGPYYGGYGPGFRFRGPGISFGYGAW